MYKYNHNIMVNNVNKILILTQMPTHFYIHHYNEYKTNSLYLQYNQCL